MAEWLLDTNVLLRIQEEDDECSMEAVGAVARLVAEDEVLCLTPQVLVEFWCSATRPKEANGMGCPVQTVAARIESLLSTFELLEDRPEVFEHWQEIVRKHEVKGKKVHDARLAAVMQAHGVENLLTFNVDDFAAFERIRAVHPGSVA